MNKFTEMTVEIKRPLITGRYFQPSPTSFCLSCNSNSEMISTGKAAFLIGCSTWAISGWIALGWVHFTNTSEGPLICKNSLVEIIKIDNKGEKRKWK
jgi:hypothetical protein